MTASLTHRGPDDAGYLFAPGVGLGQRRLKIVGIENGRQPIFNESRTVAVIANGELFDFVEKRALLEARGHVFQTDSDCELIVHLYEEHGEDLFAHLKGQFAFVLVDFERRIALLARDRVGICPLHWSQQGGWLYFGSEAKALFASGEIAPQADIRGLDHLFTFFAQGPRRTMFKNVQSIEPGTYLRLQLGGGSSSLAERRYWDLDFPDWGEERNPDDTESLVDEFESVFAHAVDLRLRADVPVVGYLSGGVDSAYVLATAAKVSGTPLPSFTIKVPDPSLNEENEARQAARVIGGVQTMVEADASLISEAYPGLITATESPVLDTSCAALRALSGGVHAQGYKVVLTGEGADEAFAGYVWFKFREMARTLDIGNSFRPSTLASRLTRKWGARDTSFAELARIDAMVAGPHAQFPLYNLVSNAGRAYYSAGLKEQLGDYVAYQDLQLDLDRIRRWHPLNQSLYLGYKVHLPGLLLSQKGDRVAMANSVEARYPFLDEDVIAFAAGIHPRFKLKHRRQDKYILRQAAARVLPREIAMRPKAMFRAPLAETFLAEPPAFVRELLSAESLDRAGYFDTGHVRRDYESYASGASAKQGTFASLAMTGVVATQLWHHLYLGGGLCSLPQALEPQAANSPEKAAKRLVAAE